jgi:CheY-like chemotaxis protein
MNQRPILYVEDEENDVLFMRSAWKKAGLLNPLKVVMDGEQAMEYLSGRGQFANRDEFPMPTLVLLDLKLPKVCGLEVLKWIREQPAIHSLPVIVLSSSNKPQDVGTAYQLRVNAYLVKPSHTQGLIEMVAGLKDFWLGRVENPPEAYKSERFPTENLAALNESPQGQFADFGPPGAKPHGPFEDTGQ